MATAQSAGAVPPEITESDSWLLAAALIEDLRRDMNGRRGSRTSLSPDTDVLQRVAELLQGAIAYVIESGDYLAHPEGLPARMANALAAIVADLQDLRGGDAMRPPPRRRRGLRSRGYGAA